MRNLANTNSGVETNLVMHPAKVFENPYAESQTNSALENSSRLANVVALYRWFGRTCVG